MISPACCCNICFNCKDQDWFMRGCQFEGHPVEIANLLTNTVFNFGRLDEAVAFPGALQQWVSKELSVGGQWDVTDDHPVGPTGTFGLLYRLPGTVPYNGQFTGHVRLTIRISELKLRLLTWADIFPPHCRHAVLLQIQWKQAVLAIESMNILLSSTQWNTPSFTFTDTSSVKAIGNAFNSTVDLVGFESLNSFSNTQHHMQSFSGPYGLLEYSENCDHEFRVSPVSKTANLWAGQGGSGGGLGISLALNPAQWVHAHGSPPRMALSTFQPIWVGSQVSPFNNWGQPTFTLQPDYTKLPTIVKRSNTWAECTNVDPDPEPPDPEPEEPLGLQQLYVSGELQHENIWAG
jgi:hypothetical protein